MRNPIAILLVASVVSLVEADYDSCLERFAIEVLDIKVPEDVDSMINYACMRSPSCDSTRDARWVVLHHLDYNATHDQLKAMTKDEREGLRLEAQTFIDDSNKVLRKCGCTSKEAEILADMFALAYLESTPYQVSHFRGRYHLARRIVDLIRYGKYGS